MSVVIETTVGVFTVDLYITERPRACLNFLKLCKIKYYNFNLFHTISRGFIAQTGDPTGTRYGGESIYGVLYGAEKRYFEGENAPRIRHTKMGLISFVGNEERMIGSQFFITLGDDLSYLDDKHCVFGEVVEGFAVLDIINAAPCRQDRPMKDVRVTHTVILDDPFPDPVRLRAPSNSPPPSLERLQGGLIAADEDSDEMEGKSLEELAEIKAEKEAKARATILEMVGDLPDADVAPPENVLFVCKLNPVTTDEDLEIIFNRFGKIKSCEVIRDKKTNESLQYAFIEFEDEKSCEDAYFKMDNILIDDRRIHVDFSQSVNKIKWHGKGKGVTHFGGDGKTLSDEIGRRSKSASNRSKRGRSPPAERNKNKTQSNTSKPGDSRSRRERKRSQTPSKSRYEYQAEESVSPTKKHRYERARSPKRNDLLRRKQSLTSYSRNKSPTYFRDIAEFITFRKERIKARSQRDESGLSELRRGNSQYYYRSSPSKSPSYESQGAKPKTKSKDMSSKQGGSKQQESEKFFIGFKDLKSNETSTEKMNESKNKGSLRSGNEASKDKKSMRKRSESSSGRSSRDHTPEGRGRKSDRRSKSESGIRQRSNPKKDRSHSNKQGKGGSKNTSRSRKESSSSSSSSSTSESSSSSSTTSSDSDESIVKSNEKKKKQK